MNNDYCKLHPDMVLANDRQYSCGCPSLRPVVPGYYNENVDEALIDAAKFDSEACITLIVHQFVQRNKFTAMIDALDDVTPRAWREQVNAAAKELEERLTDVAQEIETGLQEGTFKHLVR